MDYLWEEVLSRIGAERSGLLARLAAVSGGDAEVLAAIAGRPVSVEEVVLGVPLITRSVEGWAVLHPLWEPALRTVLSEREAVTARLAAAASHRRHGRFALALDLLAEAEAWEEVTRVISEAQRRSALPTVTPSLGGGVLPHEFGRWARLLPTDWRDHPAAVLALGIEVQSSDPPRAAERFRDAAARFHPRGDVDGELDAISRAGAVRWWMNDNDGLLALYGRVAELAESGSRRASVLAGIGLAAMAHLGDSATVLAVLADVGDDADAGWLSAIGWLRSVAHRRNGDLDAAHGVLARASDLTALAEPQFEIARLHTAWLEGHVEVVAAGMRAQFDHTTPATGFLLRETSFEAAFRTAWLGDVDAARSLLTKAPALPDVPNVLARVLESLARATIAVQEGDEVAASLALSSEVLDGPGALGQPASWYCAIVLRSRWCGSWFPTPDRSGSPNRFPLHTDRGLNSQRPSSRLGQVTERSSLDSAGPAPGSSERISRRGGSPSSSRRRPPPGTLRRPSSSRSSGSRPPNPRRSSQATAAPRRWPGGTDPRT